MSARGEAASLAKSIEDMREEFGADSDTGIADADVSPPGRMAQANIDGVALPCELDRVGKQIPDDLLNAISIAPDQSGWRLE